MPPGKCDYLESRTISASVSKSAHGLTIYTPQWIRHQLQVDECPPGLGVPEMERRHLTSGISEKGGTEAVRSGLKYNHDDRLLNHVDGRGCS